MNRLTVLVVIIASLVAVTVAPVLLGSAAAGLADACAATATTPTQLRAYFKAVTQARAPLAKSKPTNNFAKTLRTMSGLQDLVAIRTAAVTPPSELKAPHAKLVKGWQLQSDLSHLLATNGVDFGDPEAMGYAKRSTELFRDYRVAALGQAARLGIKAPDWIRKIGR